LDTGSFLRLLLDNRFVRGSFDRGHRRKGPAKTVETVLSASVSFWRSPST
jgi:hypothetical protein